MQIRKALKTDIPEIVSVLKKSLGEADLPLSEETWNYKHLRNPFGKSIVLIAEEDGVMAGVRAFMRWKWQSSGKVYSALRAVDTATHPKFQGMGIFKKLTLKAVEVAQKNDDHFIFNTPNEKSRPGYLKMGWKSVSKLNVGLEPAWSTLYKLKSKIPAYNTSDTASFVQKDVLCDDWNKKLVNGGNFFTPKSPDYLKWRYEDNPLQQYEVVSTPEIYLACYVKKRKKFKELRISECIFRKNESIPEIKKNIRKICSKFGVQFISYSPEIFIQTGLSLNGNFGPVLTVKNLNLNGKDISEIENIKYWRYSLGDLELF